MAAVYSLLELSPLIYVILSLLVAGLCLLLRLKGKLRTGFAFVAANVFLAASSTAIGQIYLYSEHATLNGILTLGIPSLAVAAVFGAIQSRLARYATEPSTSLVARDSATIGVVLLGIPVGLLMKVTLVLFALWATG